MRDSLKPGATRKVGDTTITNDSEMTYNVLVGGTGVAIGKTKTVTFNLGTASKTTYSISGTVDNAVYFGEDADEYNKLFKMTIEVYDEEFETKYKTITVDSSAVEIDEDNGIFTGTVPFTIPDLEIGKAYGFAFKRAGVATLYGSVSSDAKNDISDVEVNLAVGDVDGDGEVGFSDTRKTVAYVKNYTADKYEAKYDIDVDLDVGFSDTRTIIQKVKAFNIDSYFISFDE